MIAKASFIFLVIEIVENVGQYLNDAKLLILLQLQYATTMVVHTIHKTSFGGVSTILSDDMI